VFKDLLVVLEVQVGKVLKVLKVFKDLLVVLELQVLKELKVFRELVFRVLKDFQVLVVEEQSL
jgi:hypothetical protein